MTVTPDEFARALAAYQEATAAIAHGLATTTKE